MPQPLWHRWSATSLNIAGPFTAGSKGLLSCSATSEAEGLTKLLTSPVVVSAVVWESRFSRDRCWRLVVPVASSVSKAKPWTSTSLSVARS